MNIKHRFKGVTKTKEGKFNVSLYDYTTKRLICYGTYKTYEEARIVYEKEATKRLIEVVKLYGHDAKDGIVFEDFYLVFDNGDIFTSNGRKINPSLTQHGYLQIALNGKSMFHHRVIAMCFIPNPLNKPYVNHINGDKTDNRAENLEWCTASENTIHSYKIGLQGVGENRYNAKLTWEKVEEIRKTYIPKDPNYGTVALARKFGVNKKVIYDVLRGNIWKC